MIISKKNEWVKLTVCPFANESDGPKELATAATIIIVTHDNSIHMGACKIELDELLTQALGLLGAYKAIKDSLEGEE